MNASYCLLHVIRPAIELLGDRRLISAQADVLLLATALQESNLSARKQRGGPALSYLQFEEIAVRDVLTRRTSALQAGRLLGLLSYPNKTPAQVHAACEHNDLLAFGLGRLNYWNHPAALPDLGDAARAWEYYLQVWAPGKPRPNEWGSNYAEAIAVVEAVEAGR